MLTGQFDKPFTPLGQRPDCLLEILVVPRYPVGGMAQMTLGLRTWRYGPRASARDVDGPLGRCQELTQDMVFPR